MEWVYLGIAAVLEVAWAAGLKSTDGFTRFWPSVLTVAGMVASVAFLGLAVQKIPLGTAYPLWTGVGAVGTVILGIMLYGESAAGPRLLFIAVTLLGVVGLKMTSGH
jgi:quaternary ammonium compound-resistance protein SugE